VSIRVLVVEDQPAVKLLTLDILADAGFETAEASNAAQALELLRSPEHDIDVLFTDVRMPGAMDGFELASVAKRMHPELHVIVTSGYFDRKELPQGTTFIQKPWSAIDLISKVMRAAA
jgi:DNA-binding NtrC family response regulator